MRVVSSLSPNPSCAGPLSHAPSSKGKTRQAVPGSTPVSRYFQTDPVATRLDWAVAESVMIQVELRTSAHPFTTVHFINFSLPKSNPRRRHHTHPMGVDATQRDRTEVDYV